jgi:hypothetical protein
MESLRMGINVRNKGKAGESEWVNRYQMFFPNELKRNLLQTREGGADISGCAPFQVEVKRCEKLDHRAWWRQVTAACLHGDDIPVVAFRKNHGPWKYLLPAEMLGIRSPTYVEASEEVFLAVVLRAYEEPAKTPAAGIRDMFGTGT